MKLGSASVGDADDPEKLEPVINAYKDLRELLFSEDKIAALGEAGHSVRQAIEEFQQCLKPEAILRKTVMDGRCEACP